MPTFPPASLAAVTGGRWTRQPAGAVTGFSHDTRALTPGQAFIALRPAQRDGHDFLADARARGAPAAVVAREVPGVDLPQLVVADPLAALQALAGAHRRAFAGPVIGVTGSAGKTSTKDLLAVLLGGAPAVCATTGNLNNHLGVPLTLTRLDGAEQCAAVIEAGINQPGEMAALAKLIAPDHALVTLVGPAHLEQLGTLAGVAAEKARLLAAVRPGGWQVLPVSAWEFAPFRQLARPLVLVPANEGMVRVAAPTQAFTVLHRPERTEVTLGAGRTFVLRRVSGGMAQNAALALALAAALGVEDAVLQARLAGWRPARWRGEWRRVGEAEIYCDCYNANPASMQDAIAAFGGWVRPELARLYVLGGMEELGAQAAEFHRQLGRTILLRPGDTLCALGPHAAALRAGLLENGNDPAAITLAPDLAPLAARVAAHRGAVLLKGSRRYRLETLLPAEPETAAAPAHDH